MSLACRLFGHDFVLASDKPVNEKGDQYDMVCENCGIHQVWAASEVCENRDCIDYVVGIESLVQKNNSGQIVRNFSQRCYRCPICGEAWTDDEKETLAGVWYAVNGKAVHATELAEQQPSILLQIRDNCKTIKEVREFINKILNGSH